MSFLCETPEPQVQPTTQTVINEVPAYEQEARKRLYGRADAIAAEPYQAYTGQRIAPFTQDEQNAFAMTRGMAGQYQPAMGAAYSMTGAASQQWPSANLSAYMNPYTQGVTDIAAREAIRNSGLQSKQLNDQFVKAGSFGGYRQGVAQAEMNRNLGTQLDDIYLKGGQAAFTQAGQLFNADRDAALKAGNQFGQLATAEQGLGLRDVAAQQAVGEAQRTQDQKGYDLAYQNFAEQRDYPKSQANWLANIIKGTTQNTQSTTQGQQIIPQASPLSQIAGLGTTALGLYGLGKAIFAKGGSVDSSEDARKSKEYEDSVDFINRLVNSRRREMRQEEDPREGFLFSNQQRVEGIRQDLLRREKQKIKGYADGGFIRFAEGGNADAYPNRTSEELARIANSHPDEITRRAARGALWNRAARGESTGPVPRIDQRAGEILRGLGSPIPMVDPPSQRDLEIGATRNEINQEAATAEGFPTSGPPMPPDAAPVPQGPPPRAPSGGGAAGQTRTNTGGGGGASTSGSFYDAIRDKVFGPEREYVPLTKPIDVNAPETKPFDEKVSPWMAITRAGLGMMAAKPGQSALSAIGEGGLGGLEQLNKDVARADANKKQNIDNAFKQADFYIKKASAENDRLTKERQLAQAQKALDQADKQIALKFADGQMDEQYKRALMGYYAKMGSVAGGGGGNKADEALIKRANPQRPDESDADYDTRVAQTLLRFKTGASTAFKPTISEAQILSEARKAVELRMKSLSGIKMTDAQIEQQVQREAARLRAIARGEAAPDDALGAKIRDILNR